MGRPPCCDKVGVKKGPWTPEEDIVLVSYIQEHGPGNWRAVPTNTGLHRCSKSCRLRWTNYLRPGIKRGSFSDQEEKMIIHLQALLGNRWAAIASYLPQRTDNDIKNYWNTHLKKMLKKLEPVLSDNDHQCHQFKSTHGSLSPTIPRGQWERRLQTDIHMARQALNDAISMDKKPSFAALNKPTTKPSQAVLSSTATTYASSTDNIARLLQGWMKKSPKQTTSATTLISTNNKMGMNNDSASSGEGGTTTPSEEEGHGTNNGIDLSEAFESIFGFESLGSTNNNSESMSPEEASIFQDESKPDFCGQAPFSVLEKWLFDEGGSLGKEELIDMSLDIENPHHFF